MALNILWLARTIPASLDSGDKIYSVRLADALAGEVSRLTFVGLGDAGELDAKRHSGRIDWHPVPGRPKGQLRFLLSSLPMASVRHNTKAYQAAIKTLIKDVAWDAVVLDQYGMVWCLDVLRLAGYTGTIAHVSHDFETQVLADLARDYRGGTIRRHMLKANARRAGNAEKRLAASCHVITAITEEDRKEFERIGSCDRYISLTPGYLGRHASAREITAETPRKVIMVGSFDWLAKQINLTSFLSVADAAFHKAGIEFTVIGSMSEALKLSIQATTRATQILGFVKSLDDQFRSSRIAVMFEQTGGGFKLKMLDYIFNRVPLFAIERSLTGLSEETRLHVASFDSVEQLVDGIIASINDIARLNSMQTEAYRSIENAFDWRDRGVKFARTLEGLVGSQPHRAARASSVQDQRRKA